MPTLATVLSRAQFGIEAPQVLVEVHLGPGLPCFAIVGLPETVVRESKQRVRSAILTANFKFPDGRITVNLAPADLPKEGGRFDLPIALGLLVASEQVLPRALGGCEFYGELSLTGELRPVRGMLPTVCHAVRAAHRVVLPHSNFAEAALVERAEIAAASHLLEVCGHITGTRELQFATGAAASPSPRQFADLADVRGQTHAVRALEIAAAGAHSILLSGPPGSGKSMLAHRLCGILPPMSQAEAVESASVQSVSSRGFRVSEWARRPFRAPHHTASAIAMVGGGSPPRPGEISLAHNGVLFLDELPEFDRYVLEVLREPLEAGTITLSRGARQAEYPARFQLVAAMNPCQCGYLGDSDESCRCTPQQIQRYRSRISGPLLDRIDLHVEVPRVAANELAGRREGESSASIAGRVLAARQRQLEHAGKPNSALSPNETHNLAQVTAPAQRLLESALSHLRLSARAYHRVLRVALTIADLAESPRVEPAHVAEAIQLRRAIPTAGGR